jgi:hypothetical protein
MSFTPITEVPNRMRNTNRISKINSLLEEFLRSSHKACRVNLESFGLPLNHLESSLRQQVKNGHLAMRVYVRDRSLYLEKVD